MLYRLFSNNDRFKSFEFKKGLNIILADRAKSDSKEDAEEQQRRTRNGAGKSSIIDIVHFILGGKPEGALQSSALLDWSFSLQLDVGESKGKAIANRSISENKSVQLAYGLTVAHGSASLQTERMSATAWTQLLGRSWFGLKDNKKAGAASARQLISYFARRRRDGGYDDPVRTFRTQTNAVTETNLAVLFNLDSELVRRLHQAKNALKRNEVAQKALRDLESTAPAGGRRVDLEAQISAQVAAAELARDRLRDRIQSFNVLPGFRELERELASLNQEARDLSDSDVLDTELIEASRRALAAESLPDMPQLETLYQEAGIIFPDIVNRRYEEVVRFHLRLIENRQAHLTSEIKAALHRIESRQAKREALEARRRHITESLRASGPADELLRLRDELSEKEATLRALQARLKEARSLEEHAESIQRDIDEAVRALRQDRRERASLVDQASRVFSEISERLYKTPGQLVISATESGLKFVPSTPSDSSAGVMSMEIFCFDLTISLMSKRRGLGPGFLIHDSHLFEPVDGRQFAQALRIASEIAKEDDIQYIVTMNSDELARAEREGAEDFSSFVLEPKLSDAPDGGLFGFRFD